MGERATEEQMRKTLEMGDESIRKRNEERQNCSVENLCEEYGVEEIVGKEKFADRIRNFHTWLRDDECAGVIPKRSDGTRMTN